MSNQFHRLLTNAELHRPERTGAGNPNALELLNIEDGQYFQDTTTGSVYRYNGDSESWELLIGYDRSVGSITNIGASLTGSIVGITTEEISSDSATDLVSSIPAYMYTQLREGEDIRVIDSSNISNYASFTINSDVNAGIVNVEVQEMYLSTPLPAQSSITVEGAIYTAYNSMDPTKVQLGVERRDLGDSIGTLSASITNGTAGVTTIELKDIDPTVNIEDNQKLIIKNRAGNYDILTANGAQNLESSTGTVTVDSFIPVYDYLVDQAFLYEPSYGSGSRLTLASNSITLLTEQVSNVSNSVAGLNLYVQNNFASATLFAEFQDNTNTSISQLELNATAQQSSLELLSSFQTNATSALATINATTNAQGATISLLTQYTDDANTAFSSINSTTNALGASVNTSVQYNDVGAYIQLLAGVGGSEITLQADQINVDGVVTFINDSATTTIDGDRITTGSITATQIDVSDLFAEDITIDSAGTIESSNFVRGSSGFIIEGNGNAEFSEVTIRGSGSTLGGDAVLENLSIEGTLTVQSGGSIQGSNYSFDDTGGTIAGWIIDSGTLKSNPSGARIELNESDNRVSIFDAVGEKAVMGYLDGLDRNSGSGQWGSSNYGFWAKNGDELVIDGDVEYDSGDWLIENDASYKVLDGSSNEIIRLGTDNGNKGLFIYNTSQTTNSSTDAGRNYFTGNVIASFQDSELVVGDEASNTYMKYDDSAGKLEVAGDIEARGVSTATAFAYKNIEINSGNLSTYLKSYTHSGNTYHVLDLTTASSKESAQYIKFTVDTRSGATDRPITHIVPPSNNADDSFEITIEVSGDGGTDRDEFVSFMDAPVNSPTVTLSDGGSQAVSANFKIEAFRIFQGATQFDHVPMEGVLNSLGGFLQGVTHGQYTFRKDDDSFRLVNSSVAQTGRAAQTMYIGKLEGGALLQGEPGSLGASDGFDFIISPTKRYQNTGDNITESDDYTLSSNFDFSNELRFSQDDVRWEFDGDVYIGGTLTNPSDQRYKENVQDLGDVLEKLDGLQTVIYDLKDFLPSDETKMIGLFAQEVQEVFPEAVVDGTIIDDNNEERDMKSISYTQLVPVLVRAIQELKVRIEALEQQS